MLAARKLSCMKEEDLDRLMGLLEMLRGSDEGEADGPGPGGGRDAG